VSLTAPTGGATYAAPATINLAASAADSDGAVTKVEFYQGATKLGEDTNGADGWTFTWSGVGVGGYSLTAKAYDNSGASTVSAAVNVTVNPPNIPPTISLTAPADGATFTALATIGLSASAADSDGAVTKVEFYQGATKLGEDTNGADGWTYTWSDVGVGSYALTAKVYDDAGASTVSTAVNVTVNAPNVPPTVSLTAPSDGATYAAPADIALSANATDSDGAVTKVEFYQGATKLGEDTNGADGWTCTWSGVGVGSYSLTAKAYDDAGASTVSTAVNVTVNAPNVPPTVNLTAPTAGATYAAPATINLAASAADSDGAVTKVEFYNGAAKIGEDTNGADGWTFTWSGVGVGSYSLTAKAYDNSGASTVSASLTVSVITPPTVAVTTTAPAVTALATFPCTVTFSEAVTGFTAGEVLVTNGTLSGFSGSGATYTFTVTPLANGIVTVNVPAGVAIDADGDPNLAAPAPVTVTADSTGPTVIINQAAGQADPATALPITFDVVFSASVTGFTSTDVVTGGTAPGTRTVAVSGSGVTYTVTIAGLTGTGTVTATIPVDAAVSGTHPSKAATSTDATVTYQPQPTVAIPASGPGTPVIGTTATLTVLGGPAGSEAGITYTWSVVSAPVGGAATFSPNGTNAAKNATATFTRVGVYQFQVAITNPGNGTTTMSGPVTVTVTATLTSIVVTGPTTIAAGATSQFNAMARDQFAQAMVAQPTFSWTAQGGTVDAFGLYTAGTAAGASHVTASAGGINGSAATAIITPPPADTGNSKKKCGLGSGFGVLFSIFAGIILLRPRWRMTLVALPGRRQAKGKGYPVR
jgi:hypothetical protein